MCTCRLHEQDALGGDDGWMTLEDRIGAWESFLRTPVLLAMFVVVLQALKFDDPKAMVLPRNKRELYSTAVDEMVQQRARILLRTGRWSLARKMMKPSKHAKPSSLASDADAMSSAMASAASGTITKSSHRSHLASTAEPAPTADVSQPHGHGPASNYVDADPLLGMDKKTIHDTLLRLLGAVAVHVQLSKGRFSQVRFFTMTDVEYVIAKAEHSGDIFMRPMFVRLSQGDVEDTYRIPTWKVLEVEGGEATYESVHLSYQEYLCASYLIRHPDDARRALGVGAALFKQHLFRTQPNVMMMLDPTFVSKELLTGLTYLNLLDFGLSDEAASFLGGVLGADVFGASSTDKGAAITQVNLARNDKVSAVGWKALFDALKTNTRVIEIDLAHCALDAKAAAHLGDLLRVNRTLATVRLGYNTTIASGWRLLFSALEGKTSVSHLDLQWCGLDDDAAARLGHILRCNASIAILNLTKNQRVTVDGWKALFDGLPSNTTLAEISMADCGLDNEAAAYFGDVLRANTALTKIDLGSNKKLTHRGVQALFQGLTQSTDINLRGCAVDIEGISCFRNTAYVLRMNKTIGKLNLKHCHDVSNVGNDEGRMMRQIMSIGRQRRLKRGKQASACSGGRTEGHGNGGRGHDSRRHTTRYRSANDNHKSN